MNCYRATVHSSWITNLHAFTLETYLTFVCIIAIRRDKYTRGKCDKRDALVATVYLLITVFVEISLHDKITVKKCWCHHHAEMDSYNYNRNDLSEVSLNRRRDVTVYLIDRSTFPDFFFKTVRIESKSIRVKKIRSLNLHLYFPGNIVF